MEILLTQVQEKDPGRFCAQLPLVPTLGEIANWLKLHRRQAGTAAAQRTRNVCTLTDYQHLGSDYSFFLGNGKKMRLSDRVTKQAMNAVGFFLYTQCEGNVGDLWPKTMGAFCHCCNTLCCNRLQSQLRCGHYAASTDVEAAVATPPSAWDPEITPLQLGALFSFEAYGRCCLYGEAYVTSRAWKATVTRDNQWVVFQHHLGECGTLLTCSYLHVNTCWSRQA
jgi:hypothetical protein